MDVATALQHDLEASEDRQNRLNGLAKSRLDQSRRRGFELYRSVLADPNESAIHSEGLDRNGVMQWDRMWASVALQQSNLNAKRQNRPKAILLAGHARESVPLLRESALQWLADRGGAVLVDQEVLVSLHPRWHDCCRHTTVARLIEQRSLQLAGMLVADACRQSFHLLIAVELGCTELIQLLEVLARVPYQVTVCLPAQPPTEMANGLLSYQRDCNRTDRPEIRSLRGPSLPGLDSPTAPQRQVDFVNDSRSQSRGFVLGDFNKEERRPADEHAGSKSAWTKTPRQPEQRRDSGDGLKGRGNLATEQSPEAGEQSPEAVEPAKAGPPVIAASGKTPAPPMSPAPATNPATQHHPAAQKSPACPSADSATESPGSPESDPGVARRTAIQRRIRKKADG